MVQKDTCSLFYDLNQILNIRICLSYFQKKNDIYYLIKQKKSARTCITDRKY